MNSKSIVRACVRARVACCSRLASLPPQCRRKDYPTKPIRVHRAVPAGRGHRRRRPHRRRAAGRRARPADHHRQPRRRRGQSRHRPRGEIAARRLHDPVHAVVAHDQSQALRQAAVRRRARLRADQPGRADPADPRRESVGAGEQHPGADRACQGQPGQAQLRIGRHRLARRISPASCSSSRPVSTWCTCRTRAAAPRSPTRSADRCSCFSCRCRPRCSTSRRAGCRRSP